MSDFQTVVLASADGDIVGAAEDALTEAAGYRLILCRTEKDAERRLNEVDARLLICDADLIASLDHNVTVAARVSHPHGARIVIASPAAVEKGAVIARNSAAFLLMVKPVFFQSLALAAKGALELCELSRRHRVLSRELKISMDDTLFSETHHLAVEGGYSRFEKLVYASPKMAELVAEARNAAATELPVVIHGETGTGKELLARAIHFNSTRRNSPLHVQNCGGLPDDVLHSELFGHVRGAFTGAVANRLGLFRAADGGTVFLDEISEISPNFQVSLLRFLQEGEVKPLGSDKVVHANVRIIAASNRSLEKMVEAGQFRRDLYYRLKGFSLNIPPLRTRTEDIPVLTEFFIEKYAGVVGRRVLGVTESALARMRAYAFPGNVRELEAEVRRMVAVAEQGGYISERHFSDVLQNVSLARDEDSLVLPENGSLKDIVEALERKVVVAALDRHRWNQSRAAGELGLSRVGLANKIKRYGLHDA